MWMVLVLVMMIVEELLLSVLELLVVMILLLVMIGCRVVRVLLLVFCCGFLLMWILLLWVGMVMIFGVKWFVLIVVIVCC